MNPPNSTTAIGIDIGGTAVKAGLVAADGRVLHEEAIATPSAPGVNSASSPLVKLIDGLRKQSDSVSTAISAVGVGMPGILSHTRGIAIWPPNLPGWRNVPIVEWLKGATGLPVVLDNDANQATLGEHRCGAGRGVNDLVLLTLGTGIGSGMILGGRLYRGADENAGEWGHTIVGINGRSCACGQFGCLEAHASASATVGRAVKALAGREKSSLSLVLEREGALSAEHVVRAALAGDALARRVWDRTCQYIAVGCLNIHHALRPGRILLGGGMSAAGDALLDPVLAAVRRLGAKSLGPPPDVRLAALGNRAGFIGAALAALSPE